MLPKRAKLGEGHHAAMPFADVPAFWQQLVAAPGVAAQALRFTILTAARSGEARGILWPDVDMAAKLWTVPSDRMKGGKAHVVPLSDAALAVLANAATIRRSDRIFNGRDQGATLSICHCRRRYGA